MLLDGFVKSRRKEINGLWDSGTLSMAIDVLYGIRVFGSRFIDIIKNKGTKKAFKKS